MMNKLSAFVMGIVCLFLFSQTSIAEQPETTVLNEAVFSCQQYLANDGFENIQIKIGNDNSIWIYYENRRYRNELTALGIVLRYAAETFLETEKYIFIPRYRSVDLCFITVIPKLYRQFLNNQITAYDFIDCLEFSHSSPGQPLTGYETASTQSSLFNFDFIMQPGFKTQFSRPGDPVQMQFNFLTDFTTMIAPGTQLYGQWIFPIYNEFQTREGESRLGQLYVNQLVRLPSAVYLGLSAGLFEYSYVGFSSQVQRFFLKDQFSFSVRFDYFSNHFSRTGLQAFSPLENQTSYLLQAQYFFKQVNFRASLTWGRYVLGDQGWRVDFSRTFHELELGFMGVWNESLGFLTGLNVKLPFPIARYASPSRIRIRGPHHVRWKYRYLPCFDGMVLDTGMEYTEALRQFSLSFIRANAKQLKTALRYVKLNSRTNENHFASRENQ